MLVGNSKNQKLNQRVQQKILRANKLKQEIEIIFLQVLTFIQ
jgi:hypothetical protein